MYIYTPFAAEEKGIANGVPMRLLNRARDGACRRQHLVPEKAGERHCLTPYSSSGTTCTPNLASNEGTPSDCYATRTSSGYARTETD